MFASGSMSLLLPSRSTRPSLVRALNDFYRKVLLIECNLEMM